jgi:hypothetical protein
VFKARHKPTGVTVALKKLRAPLTWKVARMEREIEIGRMLVGHPHSMPILDADPAHTWFVMPWAEQTAEGLRGELGTADPEVLMDLVQAVCSVLADAHEKGWVHRDIKPSNILRLEGRWVVADWGIARRPHGRTPDHPLTRVGVSMGSEGFAAPELSDDAHNAGPQADIYSIGQVIGWWDTARQPRAYRPLIPESGPWRTVVRSATREDPRKRPPTVAEFRALMDRELAPAPMSPTAQALSLRGALNHGSAAAAEALVALADAHVDDAGLYCDLLVDLDEERLVPALLTDPDRAVAVVRAMARLLGSARRPERSEVDATVLWLLNVARGAADGGRLQVFEECLDGVLALDAAWNPRFAQEKIRSWLRGLSGDAASSAADMLQTHPDSSVHFLALAGDGQVDHRIRAALRAVGTIGAAGGAAGSVEPDGTRSDRPVDGDEPWRGYIGMPGSVRLPPKVAEHLVATLYKNADDAHWHLLDARARAALVDSWLADPSVGGVLADHLTCEQARTWLKDGPLRHLERAQEGFGPFASFVVRGYRGAEEVVEAAYGAGWRVVADSVAQKPSRCYASNGTSEGFVVWGRARSLRDLLWTALNEAAETPGERMSPVVVVTSDYDQPVAPDDRARQQRLADRSGVRLVHLRRKMIRRVPLPR